PLPPASVALSPNGCSPDNLTEYEVAFNDRSVYVNAESFIRSGSAIMLAGFPNYLWSRGTDDVVVDEVFGVVIDADSLGITRAHIPLPIQGNLGGVRAVARPQGGWYVLFAEYQRSIHESVSQPVEHVWF